jgi:hypothetical protein
MADTKGIVLSVASLFAEHEAKRAREREAQAQLDRKREEELADWQKRLEAFQMTDQLKHVIADRIRAAFERGESEVMFASFPSSFCTDGGRAIANADVPPINPPTAEELKKGPLEPAWLATMPAGGRPIYDYWMRELRPGGFKFSARIVNYPDGKIGDVGLFFSWPRNMLEAQS